MPKLPALPKALTFRSWRRIPGDSSPKTTLAEGRARGLVQTLGRSGKDQIGPALLLATSAGVAFWWWKQWARGSAESEAAAREADGPGAAD